MGFRLVQKSVTLNDLERRNGRVVCVISPNSVAWGRITQKWLKIHRYIVRAICSPKNLVFSGISLMAIFAVFLPRCMKCRRGLAMRILSVRQSVCLLVKRVDFDKTE